MKNSYEYAGKALTQKIAMELIIEIYSGETDVEKMEIKRVVDERHTQRGGVLSTTEMHPVSGALNVLKKRGLASNQTRGKWSIVSNPNGPSNDLYDSDAAPMVGKGKNFVYLCYYPVYRSLAEYQGEEFWACMIGSVKLKVSTEMPELPEIGLIFKTDDPKNLEQTLHNILKFRGKQIGNTLGGKWFMTCPSEVEGIYKILMESA